MKKLISIMLSVLILIGTTATALNVAASGNVTEITAEKFAGEVANLINSSEAESNLPGRESGECDGCMHDDFQTSRLIVKSEYKINTLNATTVIGGYEDLWVLQFKNPHDTEEAFNYYSTSSNIDYVEPDKKITLSAPSSNNYIPMTASEDKEYFSWGPEYIGFDKFNESVIENKAPMTETVVAVVDSGVDPDHPLLEGRVIPTKINTSSSGIRNDSMDDFGHGTQVAGVIADCTLNNVYIKPYKVIDNRGNGTVITVAAGINCAVRDEVDVINISIGFEEDSEVLKTAVQNAEEKGITVVAASGNDASDTLFYPASYSSVIKVSAVNSQNVLANFSTYGNGVDFAAPGVGIITSTLNNRYTEVRGTSFASPFAASVAAAILSINHGASPEDVEEIMAAYAIAPGEFEAKEKFGNGIIHIPAYTGDVASAKKTESPYFSKKDAFYNHEIQVEIFCDTPEAVIYYTTDRTVPTKSNPSAKIYDGNPLAFSQTVVLMAVAYSEGNYRSSVTSFQAIIAPNADESKLNVDGNGRLISYSGSETSITIPQTVNGITVVSIGEGAFADSALTEIVLPDTVKVISNNAFSNCQDLKTVFAVNATLIGDRAFYNCINLRNPFLGELVSVGSYAFYNVCSNHYLLYERTFQLDIKNLTHIAEGAFMNSAISGVELGKVSSIGKNAFSECNALVSVKIENLDDMPDGAFKGSVSLADVEILKLSYVPTGAFSLCENLKSVKIPDAQFINSNAFADCTSLAEVDLSGAEIVFSNAFSGCTSLLTLNLPSMTGFEESIYSTENPQILLPPNLETFVAEKLTRTTKDMFSKARGIKNIFFNSATDIAEYTFRACHDIYFLNIESVITLKERALTYCTIQFIDARSLESTADLPDNSGILLSNNFYESTDTAENLTVYGTPGTFVERYANKKGYEFVGIPLIINKLPEYVTENSETVYIYAIGFNLTYQWYSNTKNAIEGGSPIKGATTNSYTFTDRDAAPYYYCIITQTDMEKVTVTETDIIIKDTKPADYTEYNAVVEEAKAIDRSLYENLFILDEALLVDVSNRYSCEQNIVDAQTEAIRNALASLKIKSVKSLMLYSSMLELNIFEAVRIVPVITPIDAIYEGIEWYTDDTDIVILTKSGNIRCIGDGVATIHARVKNADGSVIEGTISIDCELTTFEKILSVLFKWVFYISSNLNELKYVI